MKLKKILPNSHYVIDIPIERLNYRLEEYTDGEVAVKRKQKKDYCHFYIYMGNYNIPSEVLIGNMLNIKIIDIGYEGNDCVRIIYDTLWNKYSMVWKEN